MEREKISDLGRKDFLKNTSLGPKLKKCSQENKYLVQQREENEKQCFFLKWQYLPKEMKTETVIQDPS